MLLVVATWLVILVPGRAQQTEQQLPVKRVKLKAQRFKFTPSRIRVKSGTRLEIELSSRDVVHGFEIPSAGLETKIPPRGKGSVTIVYLAPEKGKVAFRCSHKCGAGHSSMRGMIIVE